MSTRTEQSALSVAPAHDDPARRHIVYDFGRPAQLGREHTRRLEAAFESFARLWSSQLTAKVRLRAHLTLEGVDLVSYEEYAQALPGTTAMVIASFADREEPCVVQFGLDSALQWVVQMMGGRLAAPLDPRTFTPIELALVRHLMEGTLEHLSASLGTLLPRPPAFHGVQYNPQYSQLVAGSAAVVVARYTMRLGELVSQATVMLPASIVADRLAETDGGQGAVHDAGHTLAQVQRTPMGLTLRLAPITIAAGEVLDLAPGDLIRLPHPETRPFELVAGRTRIARATAGSSGPVHSMRCPHSFTQGCLFTIK